MEQSQIGKLLGRPLTKVECNNFDLYLEIAEENLENLLCLDLEEEIGTRIFTAREEYCTLWTGVFTKVTEVKVDGETVTNYYKAQGNKRYGEWFNSIVFEEPVSGEVEVTASWGFDGMPVDLERLLAQMFANVSKQYSTTKVTSKQVEDFRITVKDETKADFLAQNGRVISKYALCDVIDIRHSESYGC